MPSDAPFTDRSTDSRLPSTTSAWPEGTWRSPGYRSSHARALWAQALLVAAGVIAAFSAIYFVYGVTLVNRLADGTLDPSDAQQFVTTSGALDSGWALLSISAAGAFLAWLSRSVDNAPPLGAGTPSFSPRWSIGWWFVPLANLIIPYRMVHELHGRLAIGERPNGSGVVGAWWLAFIGGGLLSRILSALASSPATTVESIRGIFVFASLAEILVVASAILAIVVVRQIEGRQELRAERLGFREVLPSVAAFSTTSTPGDPATQPDVASRPSGAPRVAFCPDCGSARLSGARYCVSCGADLGAIGG